MTRDRRDSSCLNQRSDMASQDDAIWNCSKCICNESSSEGLAPHSFLLDKNSSEFEPDSKKNSLVKYLL